MKRTLRASRRSGFSLTELMVVVVIIGLLSTLVVPNVIGRMRHAQREKAKADIATIVNAIEQYAINNAGNYPDDLVPLVRPDVHGETYLGRVTIPVDPWGQEYVLEAAADGSGKPLILSYGSDGAPGGEGHAADIDSFSIENQLDEERG